jgi:GDP-D-mannose dehydratase
LGDASYAKKILGWRPKFNIDNIIDEMMEHDLKLINLKI